MQFISIINLPTLPTPIYPAGSLAELCQLAPFFSQWHSTPLVWSPTCYWLWAGKTQRWSLLSLGTIGTIGWSHHHYASPSRNMFVSHYWNMENMSRLVIPQILTQFCYSCGNTCYYKLNRMFLLKRFSVKITWEGNKASNFRLERHQC